jgi:hypothetical protein
LFSSSWLCHHPDKYLVACCILIISPKSSRDKLATDAPSSLHASLLVRLDRLAPTREVAQIGAALGRQFSCALISAALAQLVSPELIFRGSPRCDRTFCSGCGHEVVETLVEKETGKGLDAAAIWSAGLSADSD